MKRISGPLGLPHSCAEIVSPSGVFTEIGLYFKVSPRPGCAIATNSAVASVAVLIRPCAKIVIGVLPFGLFWLSMQPRDDSTGEAGMVLSWRRCDLPAGEDVGHLPIDASHG